MRLAIFIVLLALTTSVSAGGAGGGMSSSPTPVSSRAGGYSDPNLIVKYPLQSSLILYKITPFLYSN